MWHWRGSHTLPVRLFWRRIKADRCMIAIITNRTAIGFVAARAHALLLTRLVDGDMDVKHLLIGGAIAAAVDRCQSRL